MQKRHSSSILLSLALLLGSHEASAIGWSRAQLTAVLGRPLDFTAALRLDPGDSIAPECVAAQVAMGEQRVPAGLVHLRVDASSPDALVMHVATAGVVEEPLVTVSLDIGCPARMSRRFVLLADPPALGAPMALAEASASVQPVAAEQAIPVPVPAPALARMAVRAPARPVAAYRPGPRADTPRPHAAAARKPRRHVARAAPALEPVAHLRLDPPESLPSQPASAASAVEDAIQAVALAAKAARDSASAASAAEARIASLERTVGELRAEAKRNHDLADEMRQRLARSEGAGRWDGLLLAAWLLLAAAAAWLAWRLRVVQRERHLMWRRAAAAEAAARPPTPTSQLPMVTSEIQLPSSPATVPFKPAPEPAPRPPAAVPVAAALASYERTDVLPANALPEAGHSRDVSIEELLDLEQQAEFFIVLGQDDAAVDLLVGHLRDTGGGSPLPYLKLLEIYRRRNDREAYERTRRRFNQRFNAFASEWDNDLQKGRSLEEYPGVLPRLQQVWSRPLDAMAELEVLLFRKSRGDLFDLPAYREVLFLYSLARDLLDREAADSGNVDLLLPLADGGEFSSTSPHPYFGLERDSVFDVTVDERPTAPVDLDLSQPDAAAVIVPARGVRSQS